MRNFALGLAIFGTMALSAMTALLFHIETLAEPVKWAMAVASFSWALMAYGVARR